MEDSNPNSDVSYPVALPSGPSAQADAAIVDDAPSSTPIPVDDEAETPRSREPGSISSMGFNTNNLGQHSSTQLELQDIDERRKKDRKEHQEERDQDRAEQREKERKQQEERDKDREERNRDREEQRERERKQQEERDKDREERREEYRQFFAYMDSKTTAILGQVDQRIAEQAQEIKDKITDDLNIRMDEMSLNMESKLADLNTNLQVDITNETQKLEKRMTEKIVDQIKVTEEQTRAHLQIELKNHHTKCESGCQHLEQELKTAIRAVSTSVDLVSLKIEQNTKNQSTLESRIDHLSYQQENLSNKVNSMQDGIQEQKTQLERKMAATDSKIMHLES
ncbi:zinc finger CCCH domain-containing protein 13-like [Nilaparvata lugens]|uniref:zinc finger CCCH domain-containing protein 13-like n=1 Tax=Nilaparvata lugens TaxID=108931 RepID=UPI000B9876C3|nr:zinc finger CCCH domain-containing protein 13-like [Nilaparvata lugens]